VVRTFFDIGCDCTCGRYRYSICNGEWGERAGRGKETFDVDGVGVFDIFICILIGVQILCCDFGKYYICSSLTKKKKEFS